MSDDKGAAETPAGGAATADGGGEVRLRDYLLSPPGLFASAWMLFAIVSYVVLQMAGGGAEWASDLTYIPYDGAAVIMAVLVLVVILFYGVNGIEGRVWHLIGVGVLLWAACELAFGVDIILYYVNGSAVPDIVLDNIDYPFIAGYVFVIAAFLYKARHAKIYFDWRYFSLIGGTVLVFTAFSVVLIFVPTVESDVLTGSEKFFNIAYVVLDVALLGLALAIGLYWGGFSRGWLVIALSLVMMTVADMGYAALAMKDIYFDGNYIELAWVASYLLMGLGAHYQKKLHESFM